MKSLKSETFAFATLKLYMALRMKFFPSEMCLLIFNLSFCWFASFPRKTRNVKAPNGCKAADFFYCTEVRDRRFRLCMQQNEETSSGLLVLCELHEVSFISDFIKILYFLALKKKIFLQFFSLLLDFWRLYFRTTPNSKLLFAFGASELDGDDGECRIIPERLKLNINFRLTHLNRF